MRIALIGAGAVGAYFIWGFEGNDEVELTVIADGDRAVSMKAKGVTINDKVYHPAIKEAKEAGDQDIILVATKAGGLAGAIKMLEPMIGDSTIVLSLINGVDSEQKIADAIGWEHVEYSVMRIASRRTDEGVTFAPEKTQGVYIGNEKLPKEWKEILDRSNVKCTFMDNIVQDMWIKYASNIANNLPQAVLGVDASLYTNSEHGYFLAAKLWNEVYQVAKAKGIDVGEEPKIFLSVPKTSKYSTLQDLEAGRHTEVDMFAGELIRMADELGIAVPFAEYTYHAIKALEEKNDGLIGR